MTRYEYKTPGTRLWWGSVRAWCQAAHQLDRRRSSGQRDAALAAHAAALPRDLIEIEDDLTAVEAALELLEDGPNCLRRPLRGHRAGAPQTVRIMWLKNRAAALRRAADSIPPGPNWLAMQDGER